MLIPAILTIIVVAAIVWCAHVYRKLRPNSQHRATLSVASFGAALSGTVFAVIVGTSIYFFQRSQAAITALRSSNNMSLR
jgi:hypothetical protein